MRCPLFRFVQSSVARFPFGFGRMIGLSVAVSNSLSKSTQHGDSKYPVNGTQALREEGLAFLAMHIDVGCINVFEIYFESE